MAPNQPHNPIPSASPAGSDFERLDTSAVRELLEQLSPSHPEVIPELFSAVVQLSRSVTWFDAAIEERTDLEAFCNAADQLAAGPRRTNRWANLTNHWPEATLHLALNLSDKPDGLAELLALLVLALIDQSCVGAYAPSKSAVELFAQQIRGIARRGPNHPDRPAILDLNQTATWQACVTLFAENFSRQGDSASKQGKDWAARWPKWAEQIPTRPPKPVGLTPVSANREPTAPRSARPTSGNRSRTRRAIADTRLGVRTPVTRRVFVPAPLDEAPDCPEPPEEATAREYILSPASPIEVSASENAATSKAASKRACLQAIRLRNSELSTNHIEVLNDAELSVLIPAITERLDASLSREEFDEAAFWIRHLLVIALGRDPERVESIPLCLHVPAEVPNQLRIDLATGNVWCPVLKPKGGCEADAEIQTDVELTISAFLLPLPPSLVNRLERLARIVGKAQIKLVELIDPKQERKQIAQLASSREILPITRSFSRARRVLATRIQAQAHDLALTMLICGDTLGRSDAPLYYYAPTTDVLAETYRRAVWPHFGDNPTAQTPSEDCARIGSQVVPLETVVIQGFRTLDRLISDAHTDLQQLGTRALGRYHNLFTVSVTCRFALITTERPTHRKFSILRDQIETGHRLVVMDDKRVDAEHAYRLAALSPELAEQLDRYFSHLAAMSVHADLPEKLRNQALDAVESRAPLFFFLEEETLRQQPVSLEKWVSHWPQQWSRLRRNWYRHYFATRAREVGASPLLVLAQCGHLESARHPFTQSSALSAVRMCRRLEAPLSRLEESLGIRKRHSPLIQGEPSGIRIPPLRSWQKDLTEHRKSLAKIELRRLKNIAATLRGNQQSALNMAQRLAANQCDSLGELISADLTETEPSHDLLAEVGATFTPRVAAQLSRRIDELEGPSEFKLAVRRQLWRRIRSVSLKHRLELPDIGWGFVGNRAEYSPFLIYGPLALRQISAMRAEFIARSELLRKQKPQLHLLLNLVLLAGICDRDEIDRLLSDSRPIGIVRQGQPRLLIEVGMNGEKIVVGLSGAAAVVCAYQDMQPEGRRLLDSTMLCRELHDAFPAWYKECPSGSEINFLIETREIAARFDLSGAARFMVSTKGSTPADRQAQIQLLTNAAGMKPEGAWLEDGDSSNFEEVEEAAPSRTFEEAKKEALEFYNHQLLPALGGGSGRAVDERRATPGSQKQRLQQLTVGLKQSHQIEHRLALFAQELAFAGSIHRTELAASTVVTYVTSIARQLINRLAGTDLRQLDTDDFTELYIQILDEHRESATVVRTARQLLAFHRQLTNVFGLDPVDSSALGPYMNGESRIVTAAAVTESEYRLAWFYLHDLEILQVTRDGESIPREVRKIRMARLLLMLLHRTGARFREILFLRYEDIWVHDKKVLAWIRATLHRALKSPNARRLCDLTGSLQEDELTELNHWLEGNRERTGSRIRLPPFVFERTSVKDPLISTVTEEALRKLLRDAFWFTSGRHVWPHLLRHGWADRELRKNVDGWELEINPQKPHVRQLDLRTLATQLGHGSIETSIQNYLHIPWLLRAIDTRNSDIELGRKALSNLSNRSLAAIDKIRQRPLIEARASFMGSAESLTERVLIQSGQPLMPT